ncbi:MAG TPA: S41 family peptidase [Candidatus Barnesiella excrementigallinarum]|nr:S41 family peptidase [Candidatus Barnesiella excrementigallinarum]
MKKRLFFAILLLSLVTGAMWAQGQSEGMRKLSLADFAITNLYVDEVDEGKLVEDAIRGMLEQLDPHSTYTTAEETKEMNEPLQGNFSGIGIQFNMNKDTLYVIQTIVGGPSEKVGIQAGDRIISVNDTTIAGVKMKNTDIMKRLRGKAGTVVRVTVLRKGVAEPIEFRIVRDNIPIYSIDASYMVDKETGYIRVSRFAMNTDKEFSDAVKALKKKGMKNLIVDLQGNGGGFLTSAIAMADEFLSDGQTIVYTEGRRSPRDDAFATKQGLFQQGKLVLLVDESSASASEILSGAVQDWDRGIIVGRRTFGKGLVQRPIPFPDGSMIRLTIARYYTPSGRSIQKPYDKGHEAYERELLDRFNHGELIYTDSIHFPDSLQFKTLNNGRTVYGGGGIMPDVFIPLDTTIYTDFHRDLLAKGVLNQYPVDYLDDHRKELMSKYKNIEQFDAGFVVTDEMFADLLQKAEAEKVKYNEEQYLKSKELIGAQVKALIARDMFDMTAYFKIMNPKNASFVKAMEIIRNDEEYNRLLQPKD